MAQDAFTHDEIEAGLEVGTRINVEWSHGFEKGTIIDRLRLWTAWTRTDKPRKVRHGKTPRRQRHRQLGRLRRHLRQHFHPPAQLHP